MRVLLRVHAATFDLPALSFLAAIGVPLLVARTRNTLLYFLPAALDASRRALRVQLLRDGETSAARTASSAGRGTILKTATGRSGARRRRRASTSTRSRPHVYAFHLSLGHHGWFSLTPVWLLALVGLVILGIKSAPAVQSVFRQTEGHRVDARNVRRDDARRVGDGFLSST